MGKIVTIDYIDDLDNTPIDPDSVDTVEFSFRGKDYTLILTAQNGAQFNKDIARYIRAAKKSQARDAKAATSRTAANTSPRKTKKAPTPTRAQTSRKAPARRKKSPEAGPDRNKAIREWGVANGHAVSPRGRIPAKVINAYDAAH